MLSFKNKIKSIKTPKLRSKQTEEDTDKETASHLTSLKNHSQSLVGNVREKTQKKIDSVSESIGNLEVEKFKDINFYKDNSIELFERGTDKIVSSFNNKFDVDKDTQQMIDEIKDTLPQPASDMSDIFEKCKKEALQRAISSFCLGPIVNGLDNKLEARFDNLSDSYQDFNSAHNVRSHENFHKMQQERQDAKDSMMYLDDGYNSSNLLDPFDSDIEHVISAKSTYDSVLLRAATTNEEIKDCINDTDNLVFADSSLNRAKGSKDLMEFLDERGVEDELDPDIVNIEINGKTRSVKKEDAKEAYSKAKGASQKQTLQAVATIGSTAVESGAKLAVQQVVGLIVYETIDIFVDELKNIAHDGNIFNRDFKQNICERSVTIKDKLANRFNEHNIIERAKKLGVESGVAGALSVIPQILTSMLLKTPAFIISLIRESTLSTVRCVKVLMDKKVDSYEGIKTIMIGTASSVLGIYINRALSSGLAGVPLLNKFNKNTTDVLTGVFVTGIPLTAIYVFDKNKSKFAFAIR
ncbi:hypothetical protein [Desulfobaculum bizertense]|uniref:Uncharacterized protein n=1 Tax=Desulfobaculum bizertense DSM 18034 TaxID=1121442 RepID=A0A1T4VSM2_9BACT|nr:hypothetical protein [Desulfobaculum bizertense]SKA68004.1 hypothetical protein SAMN02745702_00931 [Desulfobaculum bizertense DSM 18034]